MNEAEYFKEQMKVLRKKLTRAFILLDEYEADCACAMSRRCPKCVEKELLVEEGQ